MLQCTDAVAGNAHRNSQRVRLAIAHTDTTEARFLLRPTTPLILPPSPSHSKIREWALVTEKVCSLASFLVGFAKSRLLTTKK
jgi:hypothetical protein